MKIFVIIVAVLLSPSRSATVPQDVTHKVTVPVPGNVLAGGMKEEVEVPAMVVEVSKDHKLKPQVMDELVAMDVTTEEVVGEVTTILPMTVTGEVTTMVTDTEEMTTDSATNSPVTEITEMMQTTTDESEITTIVPKVPGEDNEGTTESSVVAIKNADDSEESSEESTQTPESSTTKEPEDSDESSEDHTHNATTETAESPTTIQPADSDEDSNKDSSTVAAQPLAMQYRMGTKESSEEHLHSSSSESSEHSANSHSKESHDSSQESSHSSSSEEDDHSVTAQATQQHSAKILQPILPPLLTPVLTNLKPILPPIVDDLINTKTIHPTEQVSTQPIQANTIVVRNRRAIALKEPNVVFSPTIMPKLTTDPSVIRNILSKSKGTKTRNMRSVESVTPAVAGTVAPVMTQRDDMEPQMPTTLDPCDLLCTKFEFEPICASNGLCLYEFSNQCILDTFNCKHPKNKFAATKDDRCQMQWLDFCKESEVVM